MGPVIGLVRRHAVAVGKLPMDVGVKVGERGPKDIVELSRAVLVRRAAGLRRVVEEVIGEEFVEHFEIPAALDFLRVAATTAFAASLEPILVITCLQVVCECCAPLRRGDSIRIRADSSGTMRTFGSFWDSTLDRIGERGGADGQALGQHQRGAHSLHRPRGQEQRQRRCGRASQ